MKAKIISKYSIEVIDIDKETRIIEADFEQTLNHIGLSESELQELKIKSTITEREQELISGYMTATTKRDERLDKLLEYRDFEWSDPPEVNILDSMIPYYEESNDIIYQKWEIINNDPNKINERINELRQMLADSDYKITKCYEASLLDNPLPYDIKKLHAERQEMRNEIKQLETLLL